MTHCTYNRISYSKKHQALHILVKRLVTCVRLVMRPAKIKKKQLAVTTKTL